ncbi:response regulator [Cohnella ginsengisoli]|uniref:Response regulator n=1 Tax=Cohnella ginsengisoli TaxID=425004 RepID=A0A9X4KDM0_9BACL|nr:response regulator [Cohnella ginsengisoli]MDG0790091.1 response regulator [Cohnella ginsengisoli]
MYRLLIVDDEPIIVNGLIDYFSQSDQWPLEVYGVSSAEEALQLLLQNRMDIVITDIGMPEMNGLELQKRIVAQWPRCKIIFFDRVQSVRIHSRGDALQRCRLRIKSGRR